MKEELDSLKEMNVYQVVPNLPQERKAVGSKWVFRVKRNAKSDIQKYKARLVAQGFSQIPGQDFDETFSPVAKWESMRIMLALAAIFDLELHHLDVKTAYLHGKIEEEIYLKAPSDFFKDNEYWLSLKALYGLKQAGRMWYFTIHNVYMKLGYKRLHSDWSVYIRIKRDSIVIIGMSVDDLAIACKHIEELRIVIEEISKCFKITNLGELTWILACRVTRDRSKRLITIDQEQYTRKILTDAGILPGSNPVSTPMDPKEFLTADETPFSEEDFKLAREIPYANTIGKITYLTICTRPDIRNAHRTLSRSQRS